MSRIAIVGDVHGKIDLMLERTLELNVDVIMQVGDLGTFIFEERMDRAARKHDGIGNFVEYYSGKKQFPLPVYFIKGNHDDFNVLEEIKKGKIKNLNFMENGTVDNICGKLFGALGGNYSRTRYDFNHNNSQLHGKRRKHFNHQDVEALEKFSNIYAIIAHDCPNEVGIKNKFDESDCGSPEVRAMIEKIQPRFYFHGHHHCYTETMIGNTRAIGLGILEGETQSIYVLEN